MQQMANDVEATAGGGKELRGKRPPAGIYTKQGVKTLPKKEIMLI